MSWADIWKIILAALTSVGGIAGLVVLAVKFASNIIAERLSKKYEIKLQKDLEEYKSNLSKKEYVSKTKFDTEFSLYRELSSAFADMVKAISILVPSGYVRVPADLEARRSLEARHFDAAVPAVEKAQDTLNANIPFIPETIYSGYYEILKLAYLQLGEYEDRFVVTDFRHKKEKETFSQEAYARTREMADKWRTLNSTIREYISTLDVMDDK